MVVCGWQNAQAQVVITQDADWPYRSSAVLPSGLRALNPDTLPFSATQPFFDDFSQSSPRPDSTKWFLADIDFRYPLVTQQGAVRPPSVGALQFDGVRNTGGPYSTVLSAGFCDQLSSHYIDLRNFGPADNLRLTFFLQPQGNGDSPENTDSFRVFFRRPTDTLKVFTRGGSTLTGFQQVSIPLNDPGFFHARFQLIFENYGSQNGLLDHWFLDYVLLAPNRSQADTSYQDLAFSSLQESPATPYTGLPFWLAGDLAPFYDTEVAIRNFRNQSASPQITSTLSDPAGNNPFSGTLQHLSNPTVPASGTTVTQVSPFTDQNFIQPGIYRWQSILAASGDQRPQNDTLRFDLPVDSLLAYDDGTAEAGFGLNRDWGYGMEFNLEREDSITAVWICFAPTINLRLGSPVYMENENFRIVFWKEPHPDSVITKVAGIKVKYGSAPNTFIRYPFLSKVKVPSRFWVGVQQFNDLPLGVGFDKSFDNRTLVFYDSSGTWTNPSLKGTLMIRPEIYRPVPLVGNELLLQESQGMVYPNPVSIHAGYVNWQPNSLLPQPVSWQWTDALGRMVGQGMQEYQSSNKLPLPQGASPGLYFLNIRQGKSQQVVKVIIQDFP